MGTRFTLVHRLVFGLAAGILMVSSACRRAPSTQELAQAPVSNFNLAGTWEWYDQFEVLDPCLLRIWREGGIWQGWFIQHPAVQQTCTRRDLRLARVNLDGADVSLGFVTGVSRAAVRFTHRFEVVTPSLLKGYHRSVPSAEITMVRTEGPTSREIFRFDSAQLEWNVDGGGNVSHTGTTTN